MNLSNRRYIGSKTKLLNWIFEKIQENTKGNSFCDIFAGTGVVAQRALTHYKNIIVNDILYSNNIIYEAFWGIGEYDINKLILYKDKFNTLKFDLNDNYFSINYGNKYFGINDSKIIGYIRELLDEEFVMKKLNKKEYNILLASLIYSIDKIANTVGHYEAYRKVDVLDERFEFKLLNIKNDFSRKVKIYKEDANIVCKKIEADIFFIDPPYNSRQYSRFYHLIENLVKWNKPKLYGEALKPKPENMSEYCRKNAPVVFGELIKDINCKYIVVTYNNTYNSKSSSSKNKISIEEIQKNLNKKGNTKLFESEYRYFNAGKTNFNNHKEYLFITEVKR